MQDYASSIGLTSSAVHELLTLRDMPLSQTLNPSKFFHSISLRTLRRKPAQPVARNSSTSAVGEINAYIAVRDMHLAEAEEITNDTTIRRASAANDFVETCVKPAHSPYQAQHLPEADAVRERDRCAAVKVRIAMLRARIAKAA